MHVRPERHSDRHDADPCCEHSEFRCGLTDHAAHLRRTRPRRRQIQLMGTFLFTHGGVQVQFGPSSTTPLPPAMGYIVINPFWPPPGTVGLALTLATILIVRP